MKLKSTSRPRKQPESLICKLPANRNRRKGINERKSLVISRSHHLADVQVQSGAFNFQLSIAGTFTGEETGLLA